MKDWFGPAVYMLSREPATGQPLARPDLPGYLRRFRAPTTLR
jgi:hypothetical protein